MISALCAESARTKNVMLNSSGYSPAQCVLGQTLEDATSLTGQSFDANMGAHQKRVDLGGGAAYARDLHAAVADETGCEGGLSSTWIRATRCARHC